MPLTNKKIYIYTDASFSKQLQIGVLGFVIFKGDHEHNTLETKSIKIHIKKIQESNNIRAEIVGALWALEACPTDSKVIMYSDCQTLSGLLKRREKLEKTKFISQSKNQPLANTDLYKKFYQVFDLIKPELVWVKGHSPDKNRSRIEKNFSYVDKHVRKVLRELT